MKKLNKKGFTLIELLVVIAIIGLLSTMAVISLNSARAKSRDAKRVSDVKQMSTLLSLAANEIGNAVLQCGAAACADGVKVGTVDATLPAIVDPNLATEFDKFTDPSQRGTGTACAAASADTCDYSLDTANPDGTVTGVRIRFYLENATGGVAAGPHTIDSEGIIQ